MAHEEHCLSTFKVLLHLFLCPDSKRALSSKLTFFFIMMGCYRWNSAAARITISPQLKFITIGNYPRVSHTLNTECNVLLMGEKEIVEKERKRVWKTCVLADTLARIKMVMKTKCHLWMVDMSKIMPCFSC